MDVPVPAALSLTLSLTSSHPDTVAFHHSQTPLFIRAHGAMLAASMADGAALFGPQSDSEVLAKAREEIAKYHDLNHRALDGVAVPESVRPGCDVTLSHMGLTTLPAELIDIVKNDVARLALDNNRLPSLSGLSPRFHECSRLRYLVMRNNQMREFPQAVSIHLVTRA